ncbi:MAG: hypothetical protein AVDCRST_MAG35-714, partial [uncultured Quadrisphaera sp.]
CSTTTASPRCSWSSPEGCSCWRRWPSRRCCTRRAPRRGGRTRRGWPPTPPPSAPSSSARGAPPSAGAAARRRAPRPRLASRSGRIWPSARARSVITS